MPPIRLATTGVSQAIDSMTTRPNGSDHMTREDCHVARAEQLGDVASDARSTWLPEQSPGAPPVRAARRDSPDAAAGAGHHRGPSGQHEMARPPARSAEAFEQCLDPLGRVEPTRVGHQHSSAGTPSARRISPAGPTDIPTQIDPVVHHVDCLRGRYPHATQSRLVGSEIATRRVAWLMPSRNCVHMTSGGGRRRWHTKAPGGAAGDPGKQPS